jgi:chromosome segregation ATPase
VGGGPVAAAGPAGGIRERDEATSQQIGANLDATIATYEQILERQRTDTALIRRRITSNQALLDKYGPELLKMEDEFRKLQVEFMTRTLALKRQKQQGQISEEQYQKALTEEYAKFERKRGAIMGDLTFYREEVGGAEVRLAEHHAKKTEMEERIKRERPELLEKKRTPAERATDGLTATLEKLSGFEPRFTMDGAVDCEHCNSFHAPGEHTEEAPE